jgi:hypothetical protein
MAVLSLLERHGALEEVDSACDFGAMEIDSRSGERAPLFEELFRARGRELPAEFRKDESGRVYAVAGDYYRALGWRYSSFDIDARFGSTFVDLNVDQVPATEREQYALTMNMGTSEHVFNQYNFFLQVHNVTKVGGLMVHSVPLHDHGNHGFYSYSPTFFLSLAHYNGYELLGSWQSGKPRVTLLRSAFDRPMGGRVLLITAMRRLRPDEFAFPLQVNEPMWVDSRAESRYGEFSERPIEEFRPRSGLPDRFYIDVPTMTFHEGRIPYGIESQGAVARAAVFARALRREPRVTLKRKLSRAR